MGPLPRAVRLPLPDVLGADRARVAGRRVDHRLVAARAAHRRPRETSRREDARAHPPRHRTPLGADHREGRGNTYDGVTTGSGYLRVSELDSPIPAQTGTAEHGLAIPPLIVNHVSGADESRSQPVSRELPSIVAGGTHASLLVPVEGREGKSAASTADPLRTQSTRNETGLLVPYYSTGVARSTTDPMGTVTTADREGLVVPLRNHGVAKPTSHPIDTVSAEGNHHALVMRNNLGGAEMTTRPRSRCATLTTGGHQSLPRTGRADQPRRRRRRLSHARAPRDPARYGLRRGLSPRRFEGDKVKQAGNAVTPPAARDLGHAVAEFLLAVLA